MFRVCKLTVDIICYKCVNFGAVSFVNECTDSRKNLKLSAVFRAPIRLFNMQIQSYSKLISTSRVCKLTVDIVCYKCANFGVISCVNECTNSRKNSKHSAVFRSA